MSGGHGADAAEPDRHPSHPGHHPGHSVLQVPVPPMEAWVRARTAHYDTDYLSPDPDFVHAHVTALGPFVDELDEATERQVAAIAARVTPFDFRLARLDTFPTGIVHLVPEPDEGFGLLTALLMEAFPQFPPYGGEFPPAPHLTLDLVHDDVTQDSTHALVAHLLPVVSRAEFLDLAWYEAGRCRLLRRWPLGTRRASDSSDRAQ